MVSILYCQGAIMNREIRSRLRNGETIEKICKEYHLTLAELMDLMKYREYPSQKTKKSKELLYITERDGQYLLCKGNTYYGTYYSLEDAKKVRDYFIFSRWNKRKIDWVCEKVGVERIKNEGAI